MSIFFIFILLIISISLAVLKQRKLSFICLIVTFICFLFIGNGLLPTFLLNKLQAPFIDLPAIQWKEKNAIVLLGAGTIQLPVTNEILPSFMAYSRINKAASLYFQCKKSHQPCIVIISGGDAVKTGKSEALSYQAILLQLGLNSADIQLESNSLNTYQNAKFTSAILKTGQFKQVILVTSGLHMQRSLLYFSNFGIQAIPEFSDYLAAKPSIIPLSMNFALTDFALHEYLGLARYYFYNFFGLNKEVSSTGRP